MKTLKDNDYQLYEIDIVANNQKLFIDQCNALHKIFKAKFEDENSTVAYQKYNIFTLSCSSQPFYYLWKTIQKCIRDYVGDDRPLWMSGWLNFHQSNEVLDWHNHKKSVCHGYVSIDPKNTKTIFSTGETIYEISNKCGMLYLGPSERLHKVHVNENFDGHRITIGFDVSEEQNIAHVEQDFYAFIPVY